MDNNAFKDPFEEFKWNIERLRQIFSSPNPIPPFSPTDLAHLETITHDIEI